LKCRENRATVYQDILLQFDKADPSTITALFSSRKLRFSLMDVGVMGGSMLDCQLFYTGEFRSSWEPQKSPFRQLLGQIFFYLLLTETGLQERDYLTSIFISRI
jgi:hypothetical protein